MGSVLGDPAETFVGFLTAWLGLHILGIDQSLARQINLIRQGVAPADAFEREGRRKTTARRP